MKQRANTEPRLKLNRRIIDEILFKENFKKAYFDCWFFMPNFTYSYRFCNDTYR